ncbi:UDP-glucose 4-epimerase GalE [Patescibacteria group bacterium]
MKSNTILVVGGAGYIGSHVNRALLDMGYKTVTFDNLSSGTKENIFSDTKFVKGDLLNKQDLQNVLKDKFDAIIHLASFKAAGESMIEPEKYSENNIIGAINLFNATSKAGIKNIIFSSSAAVYGDPEYLPIDEKHPTRPVNYYGFTKLEIERILKWYDKLKNIKYVSLRYFNAVGYDIKGKVQGIEKNPANLLPIVMEVAVGKRKELEIYGNDYDTVDGTGVRDYIHVNDLADAHVLALEYIFNTEKSLTVNLASEKGLSVQQILDSARKISNKTIPSKIVGRRPGDPAKLVASSGQAQKILGWKVKHSDLENIIKTTWDVYKNL